MSILKPRIFWPITITSANRVLPFTNAAGDTAVTVATGTYVTPEALATAIMAAVSAQTTAIAFTVTVSSSGRFVFLDANAFTLRWGVTTNSIYLEVGATASNQVASGTPYTVTAVNQHKNGWYAEQAVMRDSGPIRDRTMDVVTRAVSGQTKFVTEAELASRKLMLGYLPPEKVYAALAVSSYVNQAFETFWQDGRAKFRYWEDAATLLSPVDYVLAPDVIKEFMPTRQFKRKALYSFDLEFWGYVS